MLNILEVGIFSKLIYTKTDFSSSCTAKKLSFAVKNVPRWKCSQRWHHMKNICQCQLKPLQAHQNMKSNLHCSNNISIHPPSPRPFEIKAYSPFTSFHSPHQDIQREDANIVFSWRESTGKRFEIAVYHSPRATLISEIDFSIKLVEGTIKFSPRFLFQVTISSSRFTNHFLKKKKSIKNIPQAPKQNLPHPYFLWTLVIAPLFYLFYPP